MRCPNCQSLNTKVIDSRDSSNGSEIKRRRSCPECGYRFTTFETVMKPSFIVVKNNGTKEPYSRDKLEKGIWRALQRRNFTPDQVSQMIDKLEQGWLKNGKEITSTEIGDSTLRELVKVDEVAYIRFASVYKDFQDLDSFKKELKRLSEN